MLLSLPRLVLLGWHEASGEGVDPTVGVFDLPVEKPNARDERSDMGARGFDSSGGDAHRRPAQDFEDEDGVETADAVAFEQFGDRRFALTTCLLRRRRGLPEIEQPFGAELDFAHFARLFQTAAQKIDASAMTRTACPTGNAVRPKGPNGAHRSFHSDQ